MPRPVYLDYAADMPLLECVKAEMFRVIQLDCGNAAALHTWGHRAHEIMEEARVSVARLIGAEPDEIIFVSGGSEANNTVMESFRGQRVAISSIEHPSVLEAAKVRAREMVQIPVDEWGRVRVDDVPSRVDLVSVMLANNELGTIEPVQEVVAYGHRHGMLVHTDATQAVGKIHINVKELGVDYLTLSAHKFGGPIGVGALYVRMGAPYRSLVLGGHQENGQRAGTSNVVGIAGLGAAAKWCWDEWSCKKWQSVAGLRDELKSRILAEVPYSSCNSPAEGCLPNILNMSFRGAEGESIQLYLDAEGIAVGTGSACASGDIKPSHVLMAARGDAEVAHSSIRFSLGIETTRADIMRVMEVLPKVVRKLQGMSTIKVKARG